MAGSSATPTRIGDGMSGMDPSACSERSRWAGLAVLAAAALAAAALIAPPAASASVAAKPKPLPNLLVNPGSREWRSGSGRQELPSLHDAGLDAHGLRGRRRRGGAAGCLPLRHHVQRWPRRRAHQGVEGAQGRNAWSTLLLRRQQQHHRDADPIRSVSPSTVDAGKATFALSGWLGGYADQADAVTVTATFLDANGTPVGTPAAIGPVTPAMRGNQTRSALDDGTRPAQARSAAVQMLFGVRTRWHDQRRLRRQPEVPG